MPQLKRLTYDGSSDAGYPSCNNSCRRRRNRSTQYRTSRSNASCIQTAMDSALSIRGLTNRRGENLGSAGT